MNTIELNIKFSKEAYRAYYQRQAKIYESRLKISFTDIMNGLIDICRDLQSHSFSSSIKLSQLALAYLRNCHFTYFGEALSEQAKAKQRNKQST
ncbi:MAG: hypothetical protein ACJAWV_002358 [Flammeovirgaceae bacterium]|jgi:hypothetical protein